jgi:hypothetical protein
MGVIHDSQGRGIDANNPLQVETVRTPMVPMDKQAQMKFQIENNTTALGISASYTGASFDTMADGINYTWLTGMTTSNQAGTLYIQQSDDGTNWYTLDSIATTANNNFPFSVDVRLRYIRLMYTNGATAQTSFKLSAYVTFK